MERIPEPELMDDLDRLATIKPVYLAHGNR